MPKISVVSPSNRLDGLVCVKNCLEKQTFTDFEWIIAVPGEQGDATITALGLMPTHSKNSWLEKYNWIRLLHEPKKEKDADFYNLNKAWNMLFSVAKGELIVSIVDYTEFSEDTLQKLWNHYVAYPTALVSGVGFQFNKNNELVWQDPRIEKKELHLIAPEDMEFRLASLPRAAIRAVGGIDEEYDTVVACSEKELCLRISRLNYTCLLDESIVYRFFTHEPHGKEWDKRYEKAKELLNHHWSEILLGKRLKLNYVEI